MSNLSVRIHLDRQYISNIMYRNADMTLWALKTLVQLLDEVEWGTASATENPKWGLVESVNQQLNALTAEDTKRLRKDVQNQPYNTMLIRGADDRVFESEKDR